MYASYLITTFLTISGCNIVNHKPLFLWHSVENNELLNDDEELFSDQKD